MRTLFFILLACGLIYSNAVQAQVGSSISADGSAPNNNAMLDVKSPSTGDGKGLLIPRVTQAQRTNAVAALAGGLLNDSGDLRGGAAQGLLVYQTNGVQGLYFNTSLTATPVWALLGADDSSVSIGRSANGSSSGAAVGYAANGYFYGAAVGYAANGSDGGAAGGYLANGYSEGAAMGFLAKGFDRGAAMGYSAKGTNYGAALGYLANGSDGGAAVGQAANGYSYGAAMGWDANGSDYGAAIGREANGYHVGAAVGYLANGTNYGVAMGLSADGSTEGVALGDSANGSTYGAAMGALANGARTNVAIGARANANGGSQGTQRIAIGNNVTNTLDNTARIRGNLYLDGGSSIYTNSGLFGNTNFGVKAFEIDHPLDPANKVLRHFCLEGPQVWNVYAGNAQLVNGLAVVELPEYYSALNLVGSEVYSLTPIGRVLVWIEKKTESNRFLIGGDQDVEVSWIIKVLRNDPGCREDLRRRPVEQFKSEISNSRTAEQ